MVHVAGRFIDASFYGVMLRKIIEKKIRIDETVVLVLIIIGMGNRMSGNRFQDR